MRLLDIPDHVHEVVEFGICYGVEVDLVIAQLHFGGELCNGVGFLEGTMVEDLEHLTDDFDVTANVMLGEVFVEDIIHCLP